MTLLVLGGTNDARRLAQNLHQQGISLIYSLAGLARIPDAGYQVITGGFKQSGGLDNYLKQQHITGVLDATHPYSVTISNTAREAAETSGLPCWQFDRPAWQPGSDDSWVEYHDWDDLLTKLDGQQSLFVTTGQVDTIVLKRLSELSSVLLRTAVKPKAKLCDNVRWIQAIGPFSLEQEIALMQQYNIDTLISKNSGGDATAAKLLAARQLQVSVFMQSRPRAVVDVQSSAVDDNYTIFSDAKACEMAIADYFQSIKGK